MAGKEFLSKDEAYLFNHGKLNNSYVKFGAQVLADGVHFAVWAPHASRVSVVGDFNGWNGSEHKMSLLDSGDSGVWVLFIPDLGSNELYKYEICGSDGSVFYKADPFAFFSELRPDTASITYSLEGYKWSKAALAFQKRERNIAAPMLIYEVHLGSWMRHADGAFYTYRDLADKLVPYVQEKGYTHLEVMPLMEHPLDASWGYQITGYFSATSRYGNPHDLMYFIDKCHQAGLGVIMDWVPGHFCRDSHGLGRFDGEALYDGGDHANWGTYRFNFLRAEVWSFLISNAFFWFDVYKVDGLRVDGVTSMIYANFGEADSGRNVLIDEKALEFIRTLNDTVAESFPHVLMFAEESTDWPRVTHPTNEDGLGFHYKWNMGWMNDTLRYSALPFTARPYNHDYLTFSFMYAFSENFILPFSHDEVVHGKRSLLGRMPGDYWQKFAGLRALYCYYLTHPGKKLCFMGTELAPFIEWRYDEELEWFLLKYEPHQMFQDFVTEANLTYRAEEALWVDDSGWLGFDWIDADNRDQSV
ncbi:MAG: 1,4-alpha-glucan branching protein GlgB, partial [Coriobacteriia bacterium]|nr:1,4-alpha-glucan branching protein GlgB [Coriobacteriia bacterium]